MNGIDRSSCSARRHGLYWTYDKHGCRCPDTVRAHLDRRARYRHGTQPPSFIDATGTRRRLQALAVEGWSIPRIADASGISDRSLRYAINSRTRVNRVTARCVAAVYDRLAGGLGDDKAVVTRALRRGWVGSDRWTSVTIDDPSAVPMPATTTDVVDEVLVQRVLDGRADPAMLNRAEKADAISTGRRRGMTKKALIGLLHVSDTLISRHSAA